MGGFGCKIGEGVVRYWPQQARSSFSGFLRLRQFWWKSIKKCDRESACRRTDTQTDTQTDANRFYNLSHAVCYSYGTDNNSTTKTNWFIIDSYVHYLLDIKQKTNIKSKHNELKQIYSLIILGLQPATLMSVVFHWRGPTD